MILKIFGPCILLNIIEDARELSCGFCLLIFALLEMKTEKSLKQLLFC